MTRRLFLAALGAVLLAMSVGLGSCSSRLGWGLLLWTAPEGPLPAGSIVPVYIRSNIQKLFVVGVPGSEKKIELPLWQLELFSTKRGAEARLKEFGPATSLYMIAARDGLPLREEPTNNSRKVYRLREGQTVKILEKVKGEVVKTGDEALPGVWYQVLSDDGNRGYVFSYAMRLYDEAKEGPPALAQAGKPVSGRIDLVFSRSWRPEYFQEMIEDNRLDLDAFSPRFGLFSDTVRRQVRIELPSVSQVFNYNSIAEESGVYIFEGSPLKIRIEGDRRLVASWTENAFRENIGADSGATAKTPAMAKPAATKAAAPKGPPPPVSDSVGSAAGSAPDSAADSAAPGLFRGSDDIQRRIPAGSDGRAAFIVLKTDIRDSIRAEELRHQKLLETFLEKVGSDFSSSEGYGRLVLSKSRRFTWSGREALSAGFLPEGMGESGEMAFRLFLDLKLAGAWDGAFSLRFEAAPAAPGGVVERPRWVDLLYRRDADALVLALAEPGFAELTVRAADSRYDPVVLVPTPAGP